MPQRQRILQNGWSPFHGSESMRRIERNQVLLPNAINSDVKLLKVKRAILYEKSHLYNYLELLELAYRVCTLQTLGLSRANLLVLKSASNCTHISRYFSLIQCRYPGYYINITKHTTVSFSSNIIRAPLGISLRYTEYSFSIIVDECRQRKEN